MVSLSCLPLVERTRKIIYIVILGGNDVTCFLCILFSNLIVIKHFEELVPCNQSNHSASGLRYDVATFLAHRNLEASEPVNL